MVTTISNPLASGWQEESVVIAIKSKNGLFRKLSSAEEIYTMSLRLTYEPATMMELAELNR